MHIGLVASTWSKDISMSEIFRPLGARLSSNDWIVLDLFDLGRYEGFGCHSHFDQGRLQSSHFGISNRTK